ncbi:EamA/RhaT family transporter, partial [Rhizobium ruizarguesonis]
STALSDHRKGLRLTASGGLALSMDIPLMMLADGELWSILAARSIATLGVTLMVATALRIAQGRWPVLVPGWPGLFTG